MNWKSKLSIKGNPAGWNEIYLQQDNQVDNEMFIATVEHGMPFRKITKNNFYLLMLCLQLRTSDSVNFVWLRIALYRVTGNKQQWTKLLFNFLDFVDARTIVTILRISVLLFY